MTKTILITGATQGIGEATALALAKQGAKLTFVARDKGKADAVKERLVKASGNDKIDYLIADLSLLSEVARVGREYKSKHDKLDVLINNAGAVFTSRHVTAEGFEQTFALNHLAYFALTQDLLPLLKSSTPARIVNVSSEAHRQVKGLDFDDLQSEKNFSTFGTYGRSKLCNILFTRELSRRLAGSGVTANSLHPGVVATGFGHNDGALLRFALTLAKPFLITPEKGARTSVFLATAPEAEGVTGLYFDKSKPKKPTKYAEDDVAARRLWEITEQLIAEKRKAA